jgi:hypothetical protein
MPNREEAFKALHLADEQACKAASLFKREMQTALNSGVVPPEPWALAVEFYKALLEAQAKRTQAWYAYGAVLGINQDA